MDLPFFWPYDYLENPSGAAPSGGVSSALMWGVGIYTIAPVATAVPSGVASCNITVYLRVKEGYTLTVPVMQGRVKEAALSGVRALAEAGKAKKKNGAVSSVATKVKEAAGMLAKVPFIGSAASMVEGVADITANVAAFFGWSRVLAPPSLIGTVPGAVPNLVATEGDAVGHAAQLVPGIALNIDPALAGGPGEDITAF